MEQAKLKGNVQTVLGPIKADDLGFILPHEHLFIDLRHFFIEPSESDEKELAHQPISLENLYWARSPKDRCRDNLVLEDEEMAISEAMRFRKAGGNTIVDVTPSNVGRNPKGLVHVAQATGLNVIMGTGYYRYVTYRPEMNMDSRTAGDIADEFVRDIMVGVGDTGVHAGIIGELGCSWPLTDNEIKVLHGGSIAQQRTGAAISVHFQGGEENSLFEIVKILTDAGADPNRIILCHMTMSLPISARRTRSQLAKIGCYLEYDLFGIDGTYPLETTPYDVSNDPTRINQIIELIVDGYLNNILISQDVCFKVLLSSYGGFGYNHIQKEIIPLMQKKGLTEEQIHKITVENPKRVLSPI